MSKYLGRTAAVQYLKEKHGEPASLTVGSLKTLAVRGGGPPLYKFGRKVGYLPEDLDAWVESRVRRVGSTSEAA
jgi:hypothetical protein